MFVLKCNRCTIWEMDR